MYGGLPGNGADGVDSLHTQAVRPRPVVDVRRRGRPCQVRILLVLKCTIIKESYQLTKHVYG